MKIQSYREFWPFYLSQHSKKSTRWIHVIGLVLGVSFGIYLLTQGNWWGIPAGFIVAYGMLWTSHFLVENNRPATFDYPLWSFISEMRMVFLMLIGKL